MYTVTQRIIDRMKSKVGEIYSKQKKETEGHRPIDKDRMKYIY